MEKRFHDIRTRLFLETKWFGVAILKLGDPVILQQGDILYSTIPTMAVTTEHLYINADFAEQLTDEEFAFVVLHELYHILFRHLVRAREIPKCDQMIFNMAADYLVNWHLQNDLKTEGAAQRLCTTPDSALLMRDDQGDLVDLSEKTMEEIYQELLQEMNPAPEPFQCFVLGPGNPVGQGGQEQGQGGQEQSQGDQGSQDQSNQQQNDQEDSSQQGQGQGDYDDFDFNDLFTPTNDAAEGGIEGFAMDALTESLVKDYSTLCQGGAMYQLSKLFKVEKIRWDKYLRRFLSQHTDLEDSSFQTPDRHYIPYDLIMPGPHAIDRFNNVGLFLDTSGSMEPADVEFFLSTALDLCVSYKCTVSLYLWNTSVYQEFLDLTEADIPRLVKTIQFKSGGTNYQRVTEYIQENCKKYVCYVVFTDGCFNGNFKVPNKMKKKTIFVLKDTDSGDGLSDFGKVVKFKR